MMYLLASLSVRSFVTDFCRKLKIVWEPVHLDVTEKCFKDNHLTFVYEFCNILLTTSL